MGITESKIFNQRLRASYEMAEKEGKKDIDPAFLFQDKVILQSSMALFQDVPWAIRYPIPMRIQSCLEHWNGIPVKSDMIPSTIPLSSNSNPCTQLVTWFTSLVEKPKTVEEKVSWRLYCLLFYEIKRICDQTSCGISLLTEMILLGNSFLARQDISKHLRTFTSAGQRYSLMSKELDGPGILFFLPKKGGESNWSVRLPVGETTSGNENRSNIFRELKESGIVSVAGLLNAHTAAENILRHHTETFMSMFYRVHGVILPDIGLSFQNPLMVTRENNRQQLGRQTGGQDNRQPTTTERRESDRSIGWGQDYKTDRSLLRTYQNDSGALQNLTISETDNIQVLSIEEPAAARDTAINSRDHQGFRAEAAQNITSSRHGRREISSSLNDLTGQTTTHLLDLSQHANPGMSQDHTFGGSSTPCFTGNLYDSSNQYWFTRAPGPQFDSLPPTELYGATRLLDYTFIENQPYPATATGTVLHQSSIRNTPSVNPVQVMDQQESDNMTSHLDQIQPPQSTIPITNYSPTLIREPLATSAHTIALNNPPEALTEPYFSGEAPTELYFLGEPPINLYNLEGEPLVDLYNFGGGDDI